MSIKEARAVIGGAYYIPLHVEKLKKEAGRKAVMKVNTVMAQITKALAEDARVSAERKIESELGLNSKKMK